MQGIEEGLHDRDFVTIIRIATYNLWAADVRASERLDAARDELRRIDPDVVGLQEVRHHVPGDAAGTELATRLGERIGLGHVVGVPAAPGETDGPALLSRCPLQEITLPPGGESLLAGYAQRAFVEIGNVRLAITNVHLDWRSIAIRERQIVAVTDWIAATGETSRHEILLGDFNSLPESSVYRFLMGQQTLAGQESVPWHDLARLQAVRNGEEPDPTLDFDNNPRWADAPILDVPARVDWILIQDGFAAGRPDPRLRDAGRLCMAPSGPAMVVASDHYGVVVELAFPE